MGLHKLYGQVAQADVVNLVTDLAAKAATTYVDTQVGTRATTSYVDTQVATRAASNDTRLSVKPYPPVTIAGTGTVSIDASLGTHFRCTATAAVTLGATTNATDGQVITVEFTASGAARTLTLTTATAQGFAFGTDITALTATVSAKRDYIQFVYSASAARWHVIGYVKGF